MAQHQYYCEECGKHLFDSEKDGGEADEVVAKLDEIMTTKKIAI